MRKGDDREKRKEKKRKKKIKTFLVATNVIASQPPARRPTGTPTARVNSVLIFAISNISKATDTIVQFFNVPLVISMKTS